MADVAAPPYRTIPIIPALKPGSMEDVRSFVANDKINEALGFPGQLVEDWHDKAIAKMGELLTKYRSLKVYMDACVHCGACSDKCHYFIGTQDPKNMPVARQDLMRSVYRRYFTLPGQTVSQAGRGTRSDARSAGRVVHLFSPVFRVPPLLGLLPLRNRHRRSHHGSARDPRFRRLRTEILQRDHRQGASHRQQPWPARPGTERYAGGSGRGRQGRDRHRCAFPDRCEGCGSTADHAVCRFLRRTAHRQPDRLRQGISRHRHQLDAVLDGFRGGQLRHVHRQLRSVAQDCAAHSRSCAGTGREAHRRRRVRPCLARCLQLLEHPDRCR